MTDCPRCGTKGRTIKPATLAAQVLHDRLAHIAEHDGWRICSSDSCEVVYFSDRQVVVLGETGAVPFHKSGDPDRLVCFCFRHSAADLEADIAEHGTSTIRASIKAECKAGRDDCEKQNPQGRCCLGNVGQILKGVAVPRDTSEAAADEEGCCGPAASETAESCCAPRAVTNDPPRALLETTARTGRQASWGALGAAILSSACCWLPLAAIGLGASSAGLGAFFEVWRTPLLVLTIALLGAAFYFAYRELLCAPGEACGTPHPRVQRLNRGMLWLTTVFVAVFAFFPGYVGAFTGGGGELAETAPAQVTVHYLVEGMTCAGCEGHTREAIEAIPGVAAVAVSYRDGTVDGHRDPRIPGPAAWTGRMDGPSEGVGSAA